MFSWHASWPRAQLFTAICIRTCGRYAYRVGSSPPSQPPGQPLGLIPGSPVGPIWLKPEAGHGETVPGIVLGWNHDRIHSALDSGWVLTVAVIPFDGALLIDYAKAERLVPVRDATPVDPAASTTTAHQAPPSGPDPPPQRRRRHIWVHGADRVLQPGLIMEWRRHPDQGWQALLATPGGRGGGALIQWRGAGAMRPLTDDGWMAQTH